MARKSEESIAALAVFAITAGVVPIAGWTAAGFVFVALGISVYLWRHRTTR